MNPLRRSQIAGRDRLARLMQSTEDADDRMGLERSRFERLRDPSQAPAVVSSHNLFQTPPDIAARMAALAFMEGARYLEPSAGLGRLYTAIRAIDARSDMVLVDISPDCCRELYRLSAGDSGARLIQGDFLSMGADRLGTFDRIVMNPPFRRGEDIRHIRHAAALLNPGGLIVALCADGPRQNATLRPVAESWEPLPAGSFRSEGTDVAVVLASFRHGTLNIR